MIAIVGESASGKSTLQNMLIDNNPRFYKIITYTTRPPRDNEVDGVDYHFVSDSAFIELEKRGFFAEYAKYKGWYYGTAISDCKNKDAIAILNPAGLRTLKRLKIDVSSIYLYVDRRSRLLKNLVRGDDIEEVYRRSLSDVGQFDQIENEVDYIIKNDNYRMNKQQTLECLNQIIKEIDDKKCQQS